MEASGAANEIVIGSSHHGCLHSHGLLVVAGGVLHEGPDPQRTLVVGAHIVASHKLLTELIIVGLGGGAESLISPLDGLIIDLSASVANLVILMEVSELNTTMELHLLARAELGLDLRGGDGVVASVQLVEPVVLVLRHSDGLELT